MEKEYVLNRERRGLRIRVKSSFSGLQIKECLEKAEKACPYAYIPGEMTKETDGYCVYIRRKISLKDYLKTESIDSELLYCLLYSLQELWKLSVQEKLSFYNFLFDYDAVFVDSPGNYMEFIYLPGVKLNKFNNSVKDMLMLLLIQCPSENSDIADYIGRIIKRIEQWEESGEPFPEFLVELLPKRRVLKEWKRFAVVATMSFVSAVILIIITNKVFVWPVWLIVSVAAVMVASPLKLRRVILTRSCYLKGGPEISNGEITVGRDKNWADYCIDNLMISRRHAVVIQNDNSLLLRDLFSTNGTYVDGRRLESGEEVEVVPGQIVCFGKQCSFCVASKWKISFR